MKTDTETKQDNLAAAYAQGVKDNAAGRSLNAPRYKDYARQMEWERGQIDAMRRKQNWR